MLLIRAITLNYAHVYWLPLCSKLCRHNPPRPTARHSREGEIISVHAYRCEDLHTHTTSHPHYYTLYTCTLNSPICFCTVSAILSSAKTSTSSCTASLHSCCPRSRSFFIRFFFPPEQLEQFVILTTKFLHLERRERYIYNIERERKRGRESFKAATRQTSPR